MYVEDLLLAIRERIHFENFDGLLTDWHRRFIASVSDHVEAGRQLSTNQGTALLKLIQRVRKPLVRYGMATDADLIHMQRHPDYRRALYESPNVPREVRYLGDNVLGFRFKQNDMIAALIRELGRPTPSDWTCDWAKLRKVGDLLPRPQFNWQHRIWLVPVLRHNLSKIMSLVNEYCFDVDPAATAFLRLARDSRDRPSAFTMTDDVILANVCDNPLLAGWITCVSEGIIL